jgi:hypothetical protein
MIEFLAVLGVFVLAACGLGIGLLLHRGPPQTSCGAMACQSGGACEVCPKRKANK